MLVLCILTVIYSLSSNGTLPFISKSPFLTVHTPLAYVTLRHYTLWDHRRGVIIALFVALAVTYIPVFVLGGISIKSYYGQPCFLCPLCCLVHVCMARSEWTYYVAALDTCIVAHQPPEVKGFWACMVSGVFVVLWSQIYASVVSPFLISFQR